jgi:Flp pilus assembly protein CpaB
MRRGRALIYIVLILVLALGAAFLFVGRSLLSRASATPTPQVRYVSILVVTQRIERGNEITEDSLGTIDIPEDKLVTGMLTDKNAVIGKLAKYPLEQGVVLTTAMIAESAAQLAQTGSEAAKLIPSGLTAISVPVSRLSSVDYGIRDGDHVDVIATMLFLDVDTEFQSPLPNYTSVVVAPGFIEGSPPILSVKVDTTGDPSRKGRVEVDPSFNQAFYVIPSEAQYPRPVSQMILQDVQVLRIGDFPLNQPQITPTPQGGGGGGQQQAAPTTATKPDIITLVVTPQDAVTLTYLVYSGAELTLTLRGAEDTTRVDTEAATLQFLLSQYAIPVPAKMPNAMTPRIEKLTQPVLPNDIPPVQTK